MEYVRAGCKIDEFKGFVTNGKSSDFTQRFNINTDDVDTLRGKAKGRSKVKKIVSRVSPLISTSFINGPKGGYGGLASIEGNATLMQYLGSIAGKSGLKTMVRTSKRDWKKLYGNKEKGIEPIDPLYYHYVILEGSGGPNANARVLGYIRLMRESALHDDMLLRIVIREEGRGVGKKSLYEAVKMTYEYLSEIYNEKRMANFNIVAETHVDNTLGNAFPRWGFHKLNGPDSVNGVYRKYGVKLYRYILSIREALQVLHPKYKSYTIPSTNKLEYLSRPHAERYHLLYMFNGLEEAFKDEDTVRNALRNITHSLMENGLFVVITKDSINLSTKMKGVSGSFGNDLYNITYSSIDKSSNFGIKYKVQSNSTRQEYLIKNEIFKNIAEEYDLREVYSSTVEEFYDNTREIPLFMEHYSGTVVNSQIKEVLSLLRISIFKNEKRLNIVGLIPDTKKTPDKRVKTGGGGGECNPIPSVDKMKAHLKSGVVRIYYSKMDNTRALREGIIEKLHGNKIIVVDDEDSSKRRFKLDDIRYLTREELKKLGRGSKNFRFVTRDIDLKRGDAKHSRCVYLDNKDSLWETVKNIDSWRPFVYRNEPDERCVILYDKEPKAKKHLLVVPKRRILYEELNGKNYKILEDMLQMALLNIRNNFINTRFKIGLMKGGGGQSQLHLHVISENDIKNEYRYKFSGSNFISVRGLIQSLKNQ